jgi:hypothetical protein
MHSNGKHMTTPDSVFAGSALVMGILVGWGC